MNVHPATELLSAYLDRELAEREHRHLESHVEECLSCQHRLDGLRRVVEQLQSIPSAPVPGVLARGVETRVARARRHGRLEPSRRRLRIDLPHPAVGLGFAVTVGLAMLLYFFSHGASRPSTDTDRVILSPTEATFPEGQRVGAGGRSFVLVDDVWLETQVGDVGDVATVTAARAAELAATYSWLPDLLGLGRDVVFETDAGEWVRVTSTPMLGRAPSRDSAARPR